jgi:hypothetical protein
MKLMIIALCLCIASGCTNQASSSYTKTQDVLNKVIPLPEAAQGVSHEEQTDTFNNTTTILTYTTRRSVDEIKTYYATLFHQQGWEPTYIGTSPEPPQSTDLIFGKGGQDGNTPGDLVLYRNILLSIHPCGQETCVILKDFTSRTVILEGLN